MIPFLKKKASSNELYVDENKKIHFFRMNFNGDNLKQNLIKYINPIHWPLKPLIIALTAGLITGVILSFVF